MHLRWLHVSLFCCALGLSLGTAQAQQTLYAATTGGNGGSLYIIDPATANATLVGPLLVGGQPIGVTGIAFNPLTGVLYGVTDDGSPNFPDTLVTINLTSAAATVIGSGLGQILTDISFSSTGMLYGWLQQNSVNGGFPFTTAGPFNLVSINLTTGIATVVGTLAKAAGFQDGALAFSPSGTLYVENNQAQNMSCCSPYPYTFIIGTVNPTTGVTTEGPMATPGGDIDFNAMAFNAAGTLFASAVDSDGFSSLYTIDPTTGNPTFIGSLPALDGSTDTNALAFTPVAPAFLIRYVSNLNVGDSLLEIANDGASGGNLCVGVYSFDPSEELLSCCSCVLTPDGGVSLSAQSINSNNLTPEVPTSLVIKLLAWSTTGGSACNAGTPGTSASGLQGWATTLHALPTLPVSYGVTETPFSPASLSPVELNHLGQFCLFNQTNGSGFGKCKGC